MVENKSFWVSSVLIEHAAEVSECSVHSSWAIHFIPSKVRNFVYQTWNLKSFFCTLCGDCFGKAALILQPRKTFLPRLANGTMQSFQAVLEIITMYHFRQCLCIISGNVWDHNYCIISGNVWDNNIRSFLPKVSEGAHLCVPHVPGVLCWHDWQMCHQSQR